MAATKKSGASDTKAATKKSRASDTKAATKKSRATDTKAVIEPIVIQAMDWKTTKPDNHTRFVCISDTHSLVDADFRIPPGDVLLHAGDFTDMGMPYDVDDFVTFMTSQPHPYKVVIAGNHDLPFDSDRYDRLWRRFGHPWKLDCEAVKDSLRKAPGITYLEDSGTTINGIFIWGAPWQPYFVGSAFNLHRGWPIKEKWDLIPNEVDILVTHGPPLGHGDLVVNGKRAGCSDLLNTVQKRVKPKYHVFGHIHEGYGITSNGVTTFVNASTCNIRYQPINPPIIFDLPNKS